MRLLDLAIACATAVWLASSVLGQEPENLQPPPGSRVITSNDGYLNLDQPRDQYAGASSGAAGFNPFCDSQVPIADVVIEPILWRLENVRTQPLAINPVQGTAASTGDLDLGIDVGSRLKVDAYSDDSPYITAFEVVYFGVYNWNDNLDLVAPAGTYLRLPDTLGDVGQTVDFSNAYRMTAHYDARINNVEANVILGEPKADFHYLAGLRYIRLEEYFRLDSFTDARVSSYEISTRDALWGLQLGGLWHRTRGCWELTSFLKVGIYNNNANQASFMTDNNRTEILRNFGPRATVDSFVLDAGLNASRWINNVWLIRAGYSVVWLNNIARAPDQLDFSSNAVSGGRIFFREDAVAHGFNVGLEAVW